MFRNNFYKIVLSRQVKALYQLVLLSPQDKICPNLCCQFPCINNFWSIYQGSWEADNIILRHSILIFFFFLGRIGETILIYSW